MRLEESKSSDLGHVQTSANISVKPTVVEEINPKQNRNGVKLYD